jgi:predicted N-formylglutamate amidohydrolase
MTESPYAIIGADRSSRWLITVDHATNRVPKEINGGSLGISDYDMNRHIAYDPGALGISLKLGELLNGPVIHTDFSRLVIDPNRGEFDPTLVMRLYDGTIIPANAEVDESEEERRLNAYYRPYHNALGELAAKQEEPILVAVHTFSPKLNGRKSRPWDIGILHASHDPRNLGPFVVDRLEADGDIVVGDNEPYAGHLPGDSVDKHALRKNRLNVLIEVRQDLITDTESQHAWAERLAKVLPDALAKSGY